MTELLKLAIESGIPITAELVRLYLWLDYLSPVLYIPLFWLCTYFFATYAIRFAKWMDE